MIHLRFKLRDFGLVVSKHKFHPLAYPGQLLALLLTELGSRLAVLSCRSCVSGSGRLWYDPDFHGSVGLVGLIWAAWRAWMAARVELLSEHDIVDLLELKRHRRRSLTRGSWSWHLVAIVLQRLLQVPMALIVVIKFGGPNSLRSGGRFHVFLLSRLAHTTSVRQAHG